MRHSYVLETQRLILRMPVPDDAEAVFVWVSDPLVNRFMPYNLYHSVDEARRWLETLPESSDYDFVMVRREDGLVIGSCGIGPNKAGDLWEFGYNLRADCWNHGYATEAAKAMICFAHEVFGARDFGAHHAVENPASGRVMEHCGLRFVGFSEYSTFDGSETFPSKVYRLHL